MTGVRVSPAPPQPKSMRQTKYLGLRDCHEKKYNFFKNLKIDVFFIFFEFSKSGFSWFLSCFLLIIKGFLNKMVPTVGRNRYVWDFPPKSRLRTAVLRRSRGIATARSLCSIDLMDFDAETLSLFFLDSRSDGSAIWNILHFADFWLPAPAQ